MAKIAEVKINVKNRLVQIKMNKGPNHTLEGEMFDKFVCRQAAYMCDNNRHSEACRLAADDYLRGEL